MPQIYHHRHYVESSEIDPLGHANNVAYVEWMQSAAIAHSTSQGWPMERYRAAGWSWVVRTHHVEYRRPAFLGDEIVIRTWVARMQKFCSLRKFEIYRQGVEGELLAKAETNWAFVNLNTGRLEPVPAEVIASFPPV